jgi:hypothetical protein
LHVALGDAAIATGSLDLSGIDAGLGGNTPDRRRGLRFRGSAALRGGWR